MHEHVFYRQEIQDENVFRTCRRYTYCRAPAAFGAQHLTGRISPRNRSRTVQIVENALMDRRAHRRSFAQQRGRRHLHRRADRQKSVGYVFKRM